jgi:hypothetical protein
MRCSLVLVCAALLACGSSSTNPSDMAVADLSALACAPLDNFCSQPGTSFACVRNFSDVAGQLCVPDGGVNPAAPHIVMVADCGAYRELVLGGVDTSTDSYYDVATGALVAVISVSANFGGHQMCGGGPASFVPPQCQPPRTFCP